MSTIKRNRGPLSGRIRAAWMLVAVGVFVSGAVVAAMSFGSADDPTDPKAAEPFKQTGPPGLSMPTPAVDSPPESLASILAGGRLPPSVVAISRQVAAGAAAAINAQWRTTVATCFKGSQKTGGLCADVPIAAGESASVETVYMSGNGIAPIKRAHRLITDLLTGNPGSLAFVARDGERFLLGFSITARTHPWSADGSDVVRYLWLVVDPRENQPILEVQPLFDGDPLAYWRSISAPGAILAIDEALVAQEVHEEAEFKQRVKEEWERSEREKQAPP